MKKVLLVGINFSAREGERAKALAPYYIKSYCDYHLPKNSATILIKQFLATQSDLEITGKIVSLNPDIIGFSSYIWNIDKITGLLGAIKKDLPFAKIVLGGPEVYPVSEEVLRNNPLVDLIVRGEGEITFCELLKSNYEESNLKNIAGISYRSNGSVINNPARALIKDLDEIPSPFLNSVFDFNGAYNVIHFETSRGCIFSCRFCCWTSKEIREYPLERVFKELSIILKNKTVRGICFCDSNLFFNKERAKKIFSFLVVNNKRNIPIFFELNAEFLNDELINVIKNLKNQVFSFGLQSTNPDALRAMNRVFNKRKFEENIKKLRKVTGKSLLYFDLIYGLPQDTLDGFKASIDYVLSYKPDHITFWPLLALPGSEFFNNPQKYGLHIQSGAPHKVVFTEKFTMNDIREARKLGLFINIILQYRLLRNYFYFLSLFVYKTKSQKFYLEPFLRFVAYIDNKTDVLPSDTEYCDLCPPSEEDNERLKLLRKRLKSKKIKLIKYFVIFSIKEIFNFIIEAIMHKNIVPVKEEKTKDEQTKDFFACGWNLVSVEEAVKASSLPGSLEAYSLFKEYLPKAGNILEAGCGLCSMVIIMRRDGYNVWGIDYLESALKKAKAYDSSLSLVAGDIQSLPYPDKKFNAYLSFGVLEHFEHGPLKSLREANRILAKDGIIVVSVPYPNLLTKLAIGRIEAPLTKIKRNRLIRKIFGKEEAAFYKPPYAAVFSGDEMRSLFSQTGFDLMALHPIGHSHNLYSNFKFFRKNERGVETGLCLKVARVLKRFFPWNTCLLFLAIGKKTKDINRGIGGTTSRQGLISKNMETVS